MSSEEGEGPDRNFHAETEKNSGGQEHRQVTNQEIVITVFRMVENAHDRPGESEQSSHDGGLRKESSDAR